MWGNHMLRTPLCELIPVDARPLGLGLRIRSRPFWYAPEEGVDADVCSAHDLLAENFKTVV